MIGVSGRTFFVTRESSKVKGYRFPIILRADVTPFIKRLLQNSVSEMFGRLRVVLLLKSTTTTSLLPQKLIFSSTRFLFVIRIHFIRISRLRFAEKLRLRIFPASFTHLQLIKVNINSSNPHSPAWQEKYIGNK